MIFRAALNLARRGGVARLPLVRFQTTAPPLLEKTPSSQKAPAQKPKYRLNRKVRDITQQVQALAEAASSGDLSEAVDILEEGVSYLREVQVAERVRERELYDAFQPSLAILMGKMAGASLGGRTQEEVLDMLVEHRVAHGALFSNLAKELLKNGGDSKYTAVLQLWLKFLDYDKTMHAQRVPINRELPEYKQAGFFWADFKDLAYYSFVMQCVQEGIQPTVEDALKVISGGKPDQQLPRFHHVETALRRAGATEDMASFKKVHNAMMAQVREPNGADVSRHIKNAVESRSLARLEKVYSMILESSEKLKEPVTEHTLNKLMLAFIELGAYNRVFDIFRSMLAGGITQPNQNSFDLVFKAMGHPERLKAMNEKERLAEAKTVDATYKAMLASGRKMTPKTLAYVVACFANTNDFARVDELMKKYSSFTTIDATKNNILIGLALNGKIEEAEQKLKEFLTKDPSFTPYTYTMNTLFAHYTKHRRFDDAEKLLEFMRRKNIPEDVATITTAIDFYFKLIASRGQVPDIALVLEKLRKTNLEFTQGTVNTILDTLCRAGVNLNAARAVYKHFTSENPRFRYSPAMAATMIRAELSFGSLYNAEAYFDFFVKNIENTARMWNMMIRGLLPKDTELAVTYFNRMKAQKPEGVQPNAYTFYFLLSHFRKTNNAEKVKWTLDELAKAELKTYGDVLPDLVDSLKAEYRVDPALVAKIRL